MMRQSSLSAYDVQTLVSGSRSTFVANKGQRTYVMKTFAGPLTPDARRIAIETLSRSFPHDPRVCRIVEIGVERETVYLAAPHLDGYNLHHILKALGNDRRALATSDHVGTVVWIISQMAGAALTRTAEPLDEGVSDDDLSPEELFVTFEGRAVMLDPRWTSLGRVLRGVETRSLAHLLAYSVPPSWQGERNGQEKLVFTLCTLLWELLVGYRLFRRESLVETLHQVSKHEVPDARALNPAVSEKLSFFLAEVLRGTSPLSLSELARHLERFTSLNPKSGPPAVAEWIGSLFPVELVEDNASHDRSLDSLEAFLVDTREKWSDIEESTTYTAAPPDLADGSLEDLSWLEEGIDPPIAFPASEKSKLGSPQKRTAKRRPRSFVPRAAIPLVLGILFLGFFGALGLEALIVPKVALFQTTRAVLLSSEEGPPFRVDHPIEPYWLSQPTESPKNVPSVHPDQRARKQRAKRTTSPSNDDPTRDGASLVVSAPAAPPAASIPNERKVHSKAPLEARQMGEVLIVAPAATSFFTQGTRLGQGQFRAQLPGGTHVLRVESQGQPNTYVQIDVVPGALALLDLL